MFSQRNEDKYIKRFFKDDTGRFLDIGAYDGVCFSTTRQLALNGWRGICIEPSPSVFPALQKLYKNNPGIDTLKYAVGDITGKIDFYDSGGDMISSISKAHTELWKEKGGCTFNKIKVNCLTVFDLFEMVGYDFTFINLDVEGTNIDIVKQFPFDKLKQMRMLCVEFDHRDVEVIKLVEPYGFKLYHRTAENLILTR